MKHTLVALMQDHPGVLNRVVSLIRRRNFNIDSLTVGHSETPGISRMTLVVDAAEAAGEVLRLALIAERGDLLMLDNMMVAHGRAPYTGAPVRRLGSPRAPISYSQPLENLLRVTPEMILDTARKLAA